MTTTAAIPRSHPGNPRALIDRLSAGTRRESGLFLVGIAAVAVHVVDDNFLQPQPGTAVGDHLASGLVPLALLAAAAIAYARLRPGVQGASALLAGFFGVLSGTEAAYYTVSGGPSGDDFSGMLAILGGLVLLVVGALALWRSRRTDDRPLRRYVRRCVISAGAVALAAVVLFPTALAYVVTHTARAGVPAANLGATPENVSFTTSDGLRLEGWFVPSRNGATVIVFPGRSGPQKQARMLIRHGYGVLLFDRRGEGASEGDPNAFGWVGDRDLHAAAAYLRGRPDVDPERIGGIGLSVGGEMLIHAAAHSDAFKAIVSEGASGQSTRDGLANGDTLESIFGGAANTVAVALFTNTLPPPSLKSEVVRIAPTPVFFVYGEHGQGGTERKPNRLFYAAAREPKQIWEVPGGQHVAGITTRPEEYERRVIGFLDDALLGTE
ncbi:MAG: alpha/beta hydrolase [Actinomycetota bacterium]|nr:alpha/beta hydrolase [Actinomycetota bacterium]